MNDVGLRHDSAQAYRPSVPALAPSAAAPVLSPLSSEVPGLRRWLHSLPPIILPRISLRRISLRRWRRLIRRRNPWQITLRILWILGQAARQLLALVRVFAGYVLRIMTRLFSWIAEQTTTLVLDMADSWRGQPDPILRIEDGLAPMRGSRSVAVMVQFSPTGAISEMVRRQIATYRDLGFAVVLVSNSPAFPEEDWQAARAEAALVVHRRNRGLDFGAWKDLVPVALERWPDAEELLIVNDSILGPIRPLAPVVAAMRAGGPGFFGMLESTQGGPHFQSWFLLVRGRAAVADAAGFLAKLLISRSKWKIIQRGELRFARHMRWKGHRVAAVHGYDALVDLALGDTAERAYLDRAIPFWMHAPGAGSPRRLLLRRPVNPAHHLWRVLAGPAGCPFIKTELVRRNPGQLPDVDAWADLVPPDSPCPPEMLRAHLAALGP